MRPQPPSDNLFGFRPDQEGLGAWAHATFIDGSSPICNPHHAHLDSAFIGWLWTDEEAAHQGRRILGECRLIQSQQRKWSSAMMHHQLKQWFGGTPDFVITIQADAAREMDDASFCALVEHELYHAGQALNQYGDPAFTKHGQPIYAMRGHDIEEFVGVVERYGAGAAGVQALVDAAKGRPAIGVASLAAACGTCHLRRAA